MVDTCRSIVRPRRCPGTFTNRGTGMMSGAVFLGHLPPSLSVAEVHAMVGGDHHQRAVIRTCRAQMGDQPAHQTVDLLKLERVPLLCPQGLRLVHPGVEDQSVEEVAVRVLAATRQVLVGDVGEQDVKEAQLRASTIGADVPHKVSEGAGAVHGRGHALLLASRRPGPGSLATVRRPHRRNRPSSGRSTADRRRGRRAAACGARPPSRSDASELMR